MTRTSSHREHAVLLLFVLVRYVRTLSGHVVLVLHVACVCDRSLSCMSRLLFSPSTTPLYSLVCHVCCTSFHVFSHSMCPFRTSLTYLRLSQ